MNRALILDVDEVLIDWSKNFHRWMEAKGFSRELGTDHLFDLSRAYPSFSKDGILVKIEEFALSYEYRRLRPKPFAELELIKFSHARPDIRLVAVTCCGMIPKIIDNRSWQLRGIPLRSLIALPITGSKGSVYEQWQPGAAVVIDDHDDHLKAATKVGHKTVRFEKPWNQETVSTASMSDWEGMSETLLSMFEENEQ